MRLYLFFVVSLVAACGWQDSSNYCPDRPHNNCLLEPGSCVRDDECDTGICSSDGRCVQCTSERDDACTGDTPACISDTCSPCTKHAQCSATSNVCAPTGGCADAGEVAYVSEGGTDNSTCSKEQPCTRMATALDRRRMFVKITGTINEAVTVDAGQQVTIVADPNAALTSSSGSAILTVRDDGTSLAVYDLTIRDGPNPGGIGVLIPTGGGAPTLRLHRVTVANNPGGGLSVDGGSPTVTNSFIHHNGTSSSAVGGISLRSTGTVTVEFNTIVDNATNFGAASAGGVFCDEAGITLPRNIIFRNTGGTDTKTQTFGNCTYGNSFVAPGMSAIDNSPQFVRPNEAPFDYHLSVASPPSVVGAAGTCSGIDVDGDSRPQGNACELGADELRP